MKEISFEETKVVLMGLITDLDRFCRERGLRYSLAYGTLIGAVRHKGFIPWDDDIDILMPRSDYSRFRKEYSHPYYKIESQETDSQWPLNFSKLSDTRTVSTDSHGNTSSIAVDIFILDGLEDTLEKSERMVAKVNRYHRLWSSQLFTRNLSISREYSLGKNVFIALSKFAHLFIRFDKFVGKMLEFKQKNDVDSSVYCASLTGNCMIYETGRMLEYMDCPFEDKMLMISKGYDYQLKKVFGDYMVLPPEEDRANHEAKAYWK